MDSVGKQLNLEAVARGVETTLHLFFSDRYFWSCQSNHGSSGLLKLMPQFAYKEPMKMIWGDCFFWLSVRSQAVAWRLQQNSQERFEAWLGLLQ